MPVNQRLQSSMRRTGVTPTEIARLTGMDVKTVYRWVSPGRTPTARNRALVAQRLGESDEWLWPEAAEAVAHDVARNATSEVVHAYPFRSDAPNSLWWSLFERSQHQVDLLGYTLYFLSLQHPELITTLAQKCADGLKVRAVIADPESEHVAYRDREENTPLTMQIRIQTTLATWAPLFGLPGFSLRYQDVPLYNSVFRFDDEMLVTPHLFATPGSQAPMLHLRRLGPGGMFSRFAAHFDGIWAQSVPHDRTADDGQAAGSVGP